MIDVLALPFDQYQRYRLVADLLDEVRPRKDSTWRILDVGGRTALLRSFLPRDQVTLVDLEASQERGLVLGDGSRLPFADASFDVVCAFDTLEHVPPPRRADFVAECRRVARRYVVIAGPYQTAEVEEAERILQAFLKDKLAVEHRYLEEHRRHGLPSRASIEAQLEQLGAQVASVGHGSLERWLPLMCLSMYMDYVPQLRGIAGRFHRFYNRGLYASDHAGPVYRHAVVAALDGASLPTGTAKLDAPVAPPGSMARITELAYEVIAFDREREVWEAEWDRLQRAIVELQADLEGHEKSLEELELRRAEQAEVIVTLKRDLAGHATENLELSADLEEHRKVVVVLEADLAEHARSIAEIRARAEAFERELATTRELRRRENAEGQAVRQELERILDEHRRSLADLGQDLAGHRQALADLEVARAAEVAALQGDLAAHRAVVGALRGETEALRRDLERALDERNNASLGLADARAQIASAAAALRDREALVESLRAELSSRWRSLKRALGPKRPTPGEGA